MEVSNQEQLDGQELIETLVTLTELPPPLVQQEIQTILESSGASVGNITLDELRKAMLQYLESIQERMVGEAAETEPF